MRRSTGARLLGILWQATAGECDERGPTARVAPDVPPGTLRSIAGNWAVNNECTAALWAASLRTHLKCLPDLMNLVAGEDDRGMLFATHDPKDGLQVSAQLPAVACADLGPRDSCSEKGREAVVTIVVTKPADSGWCWLCCMARN